MAADAPAQSGSAGRAEAAGRTPPARVFTVERMRAMDRHVIEELGVPGLVLMEHAAIAVASRAWSMLSELADDAGASEAVAVCGSGNNGGDGLAACRLLRAWGVPCRALLVMDESSYSGDAAVQLRAARGVGVEVGRWHDSDDLPRSGVVIDGLFGTGLSRPAEGTPAAVIGAINVWREGLRGRLVLAIDVPSGLDADGGEPMSGPGGVGACVRADATVTLGGLKRGIARGGAEQWTGEVSVGDLGVPDGVLARFAERPD